MTWQNGYVIIYISFLFFSFLFSFGLTTQGRSTGEYHITSCLDLVPPPSPVVIVSRCPVSYQTPLINSLLQCLSLLFTSKSPFQRQGPLNIPELVLYLSQTSFGHISINSLSILTVSTATESPWKDLSIDTSHISRQSIMAKILGRSTGNHHGTIY